VGNQVLEVEEVEEEDGTKLLLLAEVVEENGEVEREETQEEETRYRTIHHPDDAEIHLGSKREEEVEIPVKARGHLAGNKELLSPEDKVDLRVGQKDLVEIPEVVRGPLPADKEDEVDLRVEGKDLVEIPEEVREEIVEILEMGRGPLAAEKELLSLEDEVDLRVE